MKHNFLVYLILVFILSGNFSATYAQYQILEDHNALEKVHQAIDSIYNLNFDAADIIISDLEQKLEDYPGIFLLKAFYVRWKFRPIKAEHSSYQQFETYLSIGIEKSEELLEQKEDNIEASFYLMACHAFLAELYVNNDQNFKALGEAKSAYKYIKYGFDHTDDNPEFYFSSGIYNYYREKYPEENPFYKTFLWFFRSGDMQEGLNMLKKGSEMSVFTRAECFTYLFHINLRYEDNPYDAIYYAIKLKDKYPKNLHYISNFVENKIRLNQYDGLLPYIEKLLASEKDFYRYLGNIYRGNYFEIHDNRYEEALIYYQSADELGDKGEIRVPHHDSILYLGMGRIYQNEGNSELANQYLKKSVKAAEYTAYRKDAEALLN